MNYKIVTPGQIELECWRCGKEDKAFKKPAHPDGGGTICHKCWKGIYEK